MKKSFITGNRFCKETGFLLMAA